MQTTRLTLVAALGAALAWILATGGTPAAGEPRDGEDRERIAALIEQLGDDAFERRQQASAELERIGATALPALEQAAETMADAEVRQRCRTLIGKIRHAGKQPDVAEQGPSEPEPSPEPVEDLPQAMLEMLRRLGARMPEFRRDGRGTAERIVIVRESTTYDFRRDAEGSLKVTVSTGDRREELAFASLDAMRAARPELHAIWADHQRLQDGLAAPRQNSELDPQREAMRRLLAGEDPEAVFETLLRGSIEKLLGDERWRRLRELPQQLDEAELRKQLDAMLQRFRDRGLDSSELERQRAELERSLAESKRQLESARRELERWLKQGETLELGLELTELSPALASQLGLTGGALVRTVAAASRGARLGLQPHDIVIAIGPVTIATPADLLRELTAQQPPLRLTILRRGARLELIER